jgi:hypothetical protein
MATHLKTQTQKKIPRPPALSKFELYKAVIKLLSATLRTFLRTQGLGIYD